MKDNFVEINNLHFTRNDRCIFDNVNLKIQRGKITAIMGPSGAGKTTILRLISAQLSPQVGNILVNDVDIHRS